MGNENQKQGQTKVNETQKQLGENFKKFAGPNGELSHSQFMQALASMEEFKGLGHSPIADRLFEIFDKNGSGKINANEQLGGIHEILTSEESKIKYTFLAFDKNKNDLVSLSEFVEMFQDAWIRAFTLLQDSVKTKTSYGANPNIRNIKEWGIKNKHLVADKVTVEFSKYTQNDSMTFVQFREWIKSASVKSVTAGFENISHEIPLSLL